MQPQGTQGVPVRLSIIEKAYWEAYEETREFREALREKSREYAAAKKADAAENADGKPGTDVPGGA